MMLVAAGNPVLGSAAAAAAAVDTGLAGRAVCGGIASVGVGVGWLQSPSWYPAPATAAAPRAVGK